jgi:thiamine biosynthesis lipoprotein
MLPQALEGRTLPTATWRGIALGADASLILQHSDATAAKAAIHACLEEVARLEAIFSLHRPDSALARLNADGVIDDAPADLRLLLAEALAIAARSGGAFDPTVQPLWDLYARHFSRADAAADGPAPDVIEARRRLVDWRKVAMDGATIRLREAGMAVTLNGIAQGYITDKVGDLLRGRGFRHVLVNMGEPLALGPKWDGKAWRVAIADPRAPDRTIGELELTGGAVATSGGYGCHFDAEGRFSHLLDPQSGAPARQWASVTVISDRASLADALSTALSVMPEAAWGSVLGPELSLSRPRPDCLVFRLSPAGSPGRGPVWG